MPRGNGGIGLIEEKKSFWVTLPGILSGVAGLITAVSGAVVLWYQFHPKLPSSPPPQPSLVVQPLAPNQSQPSTQTSSPSKLVTPTPNPAPPPSAQPRGPAPAPAGLQLAGLWQFSIDRFRGQIILGRDSKFSAVFPDVPAIAGSWQYDSTRAILKLRADTNSGPFECSLTAISQLRDSFSGMCNHDNETAPATLTHRAD